MPLPVGGLRGLPAATVGSGAEDDRVDIAERAGVAEPLVYDHFGNRAGVLAELHREFDARRHEARRGTARRRARAARRGGGRRGGPHRLRPGRGKRTGRCHRRTGRLADTGPAAPGRRRRPQREVSRGPGPVLGAGAGRHGRPPRGRRRSGALARAAVTGRFGAGQARAALTRVVTAVASKG
ncbi:MULTISPECIES: TetR family transcriptional regulator [Nocardiopsis]|uniref:TetR family transcriptional regulator n=1 Tax=Nocardiopsis TaxID=2013 RepID=UPI000988E5C1